ncbi:BMC domain-containing protein [Calorimonas adulescens]|jgi:BMC domain.|uniref:BMC domain-containing protein n=1 Tax=Calorimonas adulescens TaxID=2606906 RepID=A0A5D8QES2_9THEO|nr:BMC domain-containing protein [Calorimonas adulescens]
MDGEALGFIETVGLAAAIEAADTALKTANIELIGYELTKGGGMVTVKIKGDVSAVNTALVAAKANASKVGRVYATLVIPRPGDGTEMMVTTQSTVGLKSDGKEDTVAQKEGVEDSHSVQSRETEINMSLDSTGLDNNQREQEEQISDIEDNNPVEIEKDIFVLKDNAPQAGEVCNICHDPLCPRRKGQPRNLCIHYNEVYRGDHK